MSSSSPALSPMLRDLLSRAKAEGSLEALISELLSDQGDEFELIPGDEGHGQAMTDASKR